MKFYSIYTNKARSLTYISEVTSLNDNSLELVAAAKAKGGVEADVEADVDGEGIPLKF